jgi:hypothetical protein
VAELGAKLDRLLNDLAVLRTQIEQLALVLAPFRGRRGAFALGAHELAQQVADLGLLLVAEVGECRHVAGGGNRASMPVNFAIAIHTLPVQKA